MSVDFSELNIVSVTLFAILDCNEQQRADLSDKVRVYRKGWPRYPLKRLGIDLCSQGTPRHVDLTVSRSPRNASIIRVRLQIHQVATGQLSANARSKQLAAFEEVVDIVDHIESANIASRCHAHVSWDYEPNTHETIIKLPMLSTSGLTLPFDFVSGVRFIKSSESGDISIIIDTNREGRLVATVQIPLQFSLSLGLIDNVVQMSSEIIEGFVFKIPTRSTTEN